MKWFRGQSQMTGPPAAANPAIGSGSGATASGHINGHTQGSANDMNGRASADSSYQPYPVASGPAHVGYAPNIPHRNPLGYQSSSHPYPSGGLLEAEEDRQFQAAISRSERDYESFRSRRSSSEMNDRELSSFERMRISDGAGRDQFSNSPNQAYRISTRFCSSNAIEYDEGLVDGFYCITFGMEYFPHCFGKEPLPLLEDLRKEAPESSSDLREVIEVNRNTDGGKLCRLEQKAFDTVLEHPNKEAARAWLLGQLVVRRLGGGIGKDIKLYESLVQRSSSRLRTELNSIVVPLGSLEHGLARHRALLFKALADAVGVSCRLIRAVRFGGKDYTITVVVLLYEIEYYVDLMSDPCTFLQMSDENLSQEQAEAAEKAQLEFQVVQNNSDPSSHCLGNGSYDDTDERIREENRRYDKLSEQNKEQSNVPDEVIRRDNGTNMRRDQIQEDQSAIVSVENKIQDINSLIESGKMEIKWEDITLKPDKVGRGSFGEVFRGVYCDTEVAVKVLLDQDMSKETYLEFCSEVAIMQRLRHPNIVLFMGAVTEPGHLSIVTEFLHRGSLYKILQKSTDIPFLKRLRLAHDVVKGMCYLHGCKPPIVHRDLKSPNLLVDRNWSVKVSDFGLSRVKHQTFISGKTAAGTAEWTAPEVLRNEPNDEHGDVFSFGVVLWELLTLKQPWEGMTSMQVAVAVSFQNCRLPKDGITNPELRQMLTECWEDTPRLRPSFSDLKERLSRLIRSTQSASQNGKEKVTT